MHPLHRASISTKEAVNINHTQTPTPNWPRSARFFYEDGNVQFLVDGTLFCLHRSQLTKFDFFTHLFSDRLLVPDGPSNMPFIDMQTDFESSSLAGLRVQIQEWEALCLWLYEQDEIRSTRDPELLTSLLRVACMWECKAAATFAEQALGRLVSLPPVLRLRLARTLRRPKMMERAYHELLGEDVRLLDIETVTIIGASSYKVLLEFQGRIQQIREYALIPPPVQHVEDCHFRLHNDVPGALSPCFGEVSLLWLMAGRVLHHPERKCPMSQFRDILEGIVANAESGLSPCTHLTLSTFVDDSAFWLEDFEYEEVTKRLWAAEGMSLE